MEEALTLDLADGRRLEALVAGPADGELVIAHHGTPEAPHHFRCNVEDAAARGLRLASYARGGYCGSTRHEGRGVASAAADAAALADELGADRFVVIGTSGGGPHALACAALLGGRVRAAATLGGVAPRDAEGLDWTDGMGEENQQEFAAVEAGPSRLEPFLTGFAVELGAATGAEIEAAFGDLLGAADRAALTGEYAEHMALCARDALADGIWGWFDDDLAFFADWGFDLGAIEAPVDVWQGMDDRFVPPAHGEWLAEHVAGARGHMLSGEGHLSLRVTRFGDVLDGLLASGR